MTDRELQQHLSAGLGISGRAWKTSPSHNGRAQVRWLPVVKLGTANIELGIASNASWVRAAPGSVTVFTSGEPCVFLLPVLEIGLDDTRRLLEWGLQTSGLSAEFLKVFPFEDVVVTGLESHSEHWTSLALKWADQLPPSAKLLDALQTLTTSGPTQKIRHAAQKVLARHRRSRVEGEQQ